MNDNESAWVMVTERTTHEGVLLQLVVPKEAVAAVQQGSVPAIVGTCQVLITKAT